MASASVGSPDLQLTGDDRRAGAVPVIEDLQEIAAALVGQRGECPFVDDEHLGFRELGQRLEVAAIAASDGQSRQESSQTHIENGVALPARLIGESAGEIGLADTRRAAEQDVLVLADPAAGH